MKKFKHPVNKEYYEELGFNHDQISALLALVISGIDITDLLKDTSMDSVEIEINGKLKHEGIYDIIKDKKLSLYQRQVIKILNNVNLNYIPLTETRYKKYQINAIYECILREKENFIPLFIDNNICEDEVEIRVKVMKENPDMTEEEIRLYSSYSLEELL